MILVTIRMKVLPERLIELGRSPALLQNLVEAQPEAEIRLTELARERAEAIKQEFVGGGTIDEGRL